MRDFFVSYNRFDKKWAEWIAWVLEAAGYSVFIQAWDFRPGGNFILDMQRAAAESKKTIAVLSETYLKSAYTQPEWAAAFVDDPSSLERKLLPVRVQDCQPEGMLKPLVYVDLVGVPRDEAEQRLLDMVQDRVKPEQEPAFPGDVSAATPPEAEPAKAFPPEAPAPSMIIQSRVKSIKARTLEQQLNALEEDYTAAFNQLNSAIDEVVRTRLERRIQTIEQEMDGVAAKLDALQQA